MGDFDKAWVSTELKLKKPALNENRNLWRFAKTRNKAVRHDGNHQSFGLIISEFRPTKTVTVIITGYAKLTVGQ
jgi:hypothetical protein